FKKSDGWSVEQYVEQFKVTIKDKISEYVTDELCDKITAALKKFTDPIANDEGDVEGSLDVIQKAVVTCAGKYKNFENIVKVWLKTILLTNGEIKGSFEKYLTGNEGNLQLQYKGVANSRIRNDNIGNITDVIIKRLSQESQQAQSAVSAHGHYKDGVESDLKSIQKCLQTFAEQIGNKVTGGTFEALLNGIVADMHSAVQMTDKITTNNYIDLNRALRYTFYQLLGIAQGAAEKIDELLAQCKLAKVDEAIQRVAGLPEKMSTELTPVPGMKKLGNNIEEDLKGKVDDKNVDAALATLLREAATNGIGKLQVAVTAMVDGPPKMINTTLKEIREELEKLQTRLHDEGVTHGADNGDSPLEKDANELHKKIEEFVTTTVGKDSTQKGSIYAELNGLKKIIKTLGDKVEEVSSNVDEVQTQLTLRIKQTNELLAGATDKANRLMSELHVVIDAKTTKISQEIQKHAKHIYTKRKTQEVTALQEIVNKQFNEIDDIIKADITLGLKSYLSKLQNQFMPPLSSFTQPAPRAQLPEKKLSDLAPKVKDSFKNLFDALYIQPDLLPLTGRIHAISKALDTLLAPLTRYDNTFTKNLAKVKSEIDDFAQQTYANTAQKVSRSLVPGLSAFVRELEKAYVRVYDNGRIFKWESIDESENQMMSKICFTVVSILHNALKVIKKYGGVRWKFEQIKQSSELGKFFVNQGYRVSENDKKHWELQEKISMTGQTIHKRLVGDDDNHVYKTDNMKNSALETLHEHLETYYQVSHVATFNSKKRPCNVFEMLCWLSGLPCNDVYGELLQTGLSGPFEDPKKQKTEEGEDFEFTVTTPDALQMEAYPKDITYEGVAEVPRYLCSKSYDILTTICGNGDAYTQYAVDFCTNSLNLHYPSKGEECLDMLLDILRRLFPVLQFLQTQC
ncbi:hypothetical protein, conserved, partial [Babesia bigemina]